MEANNQSDANSDPQVAEQTAPQLLPTDDSMEQQRRSQPSASMYQSFFDKENLYPELKSVEIGEELEEFYAIRKHFLIFTEAGKPVYTRHGDEQVIAPFFATMSAIIPKIQSFFWNNAINAKEQTNKLKWFEADNFQCAILKKGNFFYLCICNNRQGVDYLDEKEDTHKVNTKKRIRKVKESSTFIRK